MLGETVSVLALASLTVLPGSAQKSDSASESSQTSGIALHGRLGCDYPDSFCFWGHLFDATGPKWASPKPMSEGPIDV